MLRARHLRRAGPARNRRLKQSPKPPGRSLMSVRGNAAPRGMTAHDRIRLIGSLAELHGSTKRQPRPGSFLAGAGHFLGV